MRTTRIAFTLEAVYSGLYQHISKSQNYLFDKPLTESFGPEGAQGPQSAYPIIYKTRESAEEACNNVNNYLIRKHGGIPIYRVTEVLVEE